MNKLSLVLYVTFLIVVSGLRISDVVETHSEPQKHLSEPKKHESESEHIASQTSAHHDHNEDLECKNGKQFQSPVNIVLDQTKRKKHSAVLILDYKEAISGDFAWNGHTWQLNVPDSKNYFVKYTDPVTVKQYEYQLVQLHSHVPSEHTINDRRYPFEIHFVHKLITEDPSYQFQYLVIGILASYRKRSSQVFHQLNANEHSTFSALPEIIGGQKLVHYKGSLTTPPYKEAVNWFVVRRSFFVSQRKVQGFHHELLSKIGRDSNSRSTCNIYGRRLYALRGQTQTK